jgi:hypothetical protein
MATSSAHGTYWLRSGCLRCHEEICDCGATTSTLETTTFFADAAATTRVEVNIPATSPVVVSPPKRLKDRKRKQDDNIIEGKKLVSGAREEQETRRMEKRVKVLPQQLLNRATHHDPQEPNEPPPPITDLVSLLIVGDSAVGKSSLIKSFVSHYSTGMVQDGGCQAMGNANYREPVPVNSRTWSVSYAKKKFVFMNKHNTLKSLFVQLLEATDIDPNCATTGRMRHQSEWKRLWKKSNTVVLVVNISDSIESILKQIQSWKRWLDCQNPQKPVVLMLHQGDKLMPSLAGARDQANSQHSFHHPSFWIHFGKLVSELCHKLGIQSWHITSSCLEDDDLGGSVDTAFREILGDKGKPQTVTASFSASFSTQTPLAAHPDGASPDRSRAKKSSRIISPM